MYLSLVDICLDTIVQNFNRFNSVFTSSTDEKMKRRFEFLQRKYSFDLVSRVTAKEDIQEEQVDFLINKYLKVLDTVWLKNCSWAKIISKVAEIGSNIEKIYFQDVYFEEFDEETPYQDLICYLPNLKSFTYHDDCNDLILKNIAKFCPDIEEIDFQNSAVSLDAIKSLCRHETGKAVYTKLKKLCIVGTNIREEDVKYLLKNFSSLEVIDYPELPYVLYTMHKNDLPALEKVEPYNIATLDLINYAHSHFFGDLLKICLSLCPRLKSLICGLVSEKELNFFPSLFDLEQLNIEGLSDSEININSLLKSIGGKLTYLAVTNCTVSMSVIAESCPRISELVLNRVHFLFDDDSKPVLNKLSACTFENTNVSTSAKAINLLLSSSTTLASLSFKRCNLLSSEIKAHILKYCEMYPVKKISFCASAIEKEYIKDLLLACHTLSYLNVDGCFDNVDDEDELLRIAEILPNKPEIDVSEHISDYEEYLNGNYELEDYDIEYGYDYEYDDDYDFDDDYEYEYDSDERDDS